MLRFPLPRFAMLKAIVHFSLKFRGVVIALACLLIGYGLYTAQNAKLDVFPDFVQPQVVIQTECPGLAPEQVELLVTTPLESIVNGLGDMESLRSESIQGLSIITAVFKEGTYVFRALGDVAGGPSRTIEYSYPDEYHFYPPNFLALRSISADTGGVYEPTGPEIFDPKGETVDVHTRLWPLLVSLALVIYVADVFLRRLRLFEL